jgi:hypothetical protein
VVSVFRIRLHFLLLVLCVGFATHAFGTTKPQVKACSMSLARLLLYLKRKNKEDPIVERYRDQITNLFDDENPKTLKKALEKPYRNHIAGAPGVTNPQGIHVRSDIEGTPFFPIIHGHELQHRIDMLNGKVVGTKKFFGGVIPFSLTFKDKRPSLELGFSVEVSPMMEVAAELRAFHRMHKIFTTLYGPADFERLHEMRNQSQTFFCSSLWASVYEQFSDDPFAFIYLSTKFHRILVKHNLSESNLEEWIPKYTGVAVDSYHPPVYLNYWFDFLVSAHAGKQ